MQYRNMKREFQKEANGYIEALKKGRLVPANGKLNNIDATAGMASCLDTAQTILFSSEQAQVFLGISKTYGDVLDYRLPFENVFIQLTSPVAFEFDDSILLNLEYVALAQHVIDNEVLKEGNLVFFANVEGEDRALEFDTDESLFVNVAYFVTRREAGRRPVIFKIMWYAGAYNSLLEDGPGASIFKPLAIACIGYINCENIYLHKEGEVPDKVNRKREREGKKILEPYYVCRIRGVQYDSNGEPIGEGTHHGFRYDVRGHFRKLTNGKTTWVRPHQRGLQNELYIPKTYVVEKGAKEVTA